nr:berberine bridge enzyme-like 8 [Oryza sativa Japonica Group]
MLDEVYYAIANKTSRLGFPESVSLTVGISGYLSGGGFDLMLRKHTASPSTTSTTPPWWTPREGSSTGRHGGGPLLGHPRRRRRKLRDRLVLEAPRVAPSLPNDTFLRVVVPLYLGTRAGLVAAMADTFPELNVTVSDCTE